MQCTPDAHNSNSPVDQMSLNILLAASSVIWIIDIKSRWNCSVGSALRKLKRLQSMGLMIAGAFCLLVGLVFLPLPPPFFGMVFIAFGVPLLAAGSKRTRRFIQHLRWRYYRHNAKVEYLLNRMPGFVRRHGKKTRPDGLVRSHKIATAAKERLRPKG